MWIFVKNRTMRGWRSLEVTIAFRTGRGGDDLEQAYRVGEVEEILSEMKLLAEIPDDILETDGNSQIVISGWRVHIPELGLDLHEGIICCYDENEGGYLPDFAVTVVKEGGQEEWIYYEQDGFLITLANYLHGKMEPVQLRQLCCFICLPERSLPAEK